MHVYKYTRTYKYRYICLNLVADAAYIYVGTAMDIINTVSTGENYLEVHLC